MHQRRRLQGVLTPLAPEIRPRQAMQLVVDQRQKLMHRLFLAPPYLAQQPRNFASVAHRLIVSDYIAPPRHASAHATVFFPSRDRRERFPVFEPPNRHA
jgi:hypothetical protein